MSGELEKEVSEYDLCCDGCDRDIPKGEPFLFGIESCCGGGCRRSLCKECVDAAYELMKPDPMDRATKMMKTPMLDDEC